MQGTEQDDIKQRKADHIDLAFASQAGKESRDLRFYYEPALSGHPEREGNLPVTFLGKRLGYPIWVSSMTGGTAMAQKINANLARMCGEFGFGMGLGSCRILLERPELLPDFDVRDLMGPELPLYANLGIAQVERMLTLGETDRISDLISMLRADGLIVHINPLQEWLQPGGDVFRMPPADVIQSLCDRTNVQIIVKEVGQGMGPESLRRLMSLPIAAIELAAYGGTNFATLELHREQNVMRQEQYARIGAIGHSAEEMVDFINQITEEMHGQSPCREVIISGGVRDFLDGFYLLKKLTLPALYGHASGFLKYAKEDYEQLRAFARIQTAGLKLAFTYLRIR